MYRILCISDDRSEQCWHRLLLERKGYCVVLTMDAVEASSSIRRADPDAILLGTALPVEDRTKLSLFGVISNIPVVCLYGLESAARCPDVHILTSDAPTRLLPVFAELFGNDKRIHRRTARLPC